MNSNGNCGSGGGLAESTARLRYLHLLILLWRISNEGTFQRSIIILGTDSDYSSTIYTPSNDLVYADVLGKLHLAWGGQLYWGHRLLWHFGRKVYDETMGVEEDLVRGNSGELASIETQLSRALE